MNGQLELRAEIFWFPAALLGSMHNCALLLMTPIDKVTLPYFGWWIFFSLDGFE